MHPSAALLVSLLVVAPALSSLASRRDDPLSLKREFKPEAPLKFKTTHAETFKVEGDAAADLSFHGDAVLEAALTRTAPGVDAFEVAAAYLSGTGHRWVGAEKDPIDSVKFDARTAILRADGKKTSLAKDRVLDAGDGWPRQSTLDWFDGRLSAAARLAGGVSIVGGHGATQARLNLAFPPLPSEPVAKEGRSDADFVLGYLGQEAQVQVFYASFAKDWNEKTATFVHSGKPKLVKFEKPASRPAEPLEVTLDEEKSSYSATCVISRADGAVTLREGEIILTFRVSDPAKKSAPQTVTAKLWSKIERL